MQRCFKCYSNEEADQIILHKPLEIDTAKLILYFVVKVMEDLFKIVLAGRNEFKVSDTHQNYIINTAKLILYFVVKVMEDLFKIVLAGRNEFEVSDTHQNYNNKYIL